MKGGANMEPFELVKIKDNASGLGLFCLFVLNVTLKRRWL